MTLTVVSIHDVGSPRLCGGIKKARLVDLSPNGSLAVECIGGCGCLGNVDEDRSFVATRYSIFTRSLGMLVPFHRDLKSEHQYRWVSRDDDNMDIHWHQRGWSG